MESQQKVLWQQIRDLCRCIVETFPRGKQGLLQGYSKDVSRIAKGNSTLPNSGTHSHLLKVPLFITNRKERMNGYLWCPLAQQSICWPPGSLGTFSSSLPGSYPKLLQPVYCLCTSFLFLCNPAYLAIAVLVLSSVVLSYPPPHLVPLTPSPFAHILFFSLIPLSPIPSQSQVQSTTTFSPLLSLSRDYQTLPDAQAIFFLIFIIKPFSQAYLGAVMSSASDLGT